MTPQHSPQRSPRPIETEHEHLRGLLDRTSQCLIEPPTSRDRLVSVLGELLATIQEHFQHEEDGGYFTDLIEVSPNLNGRAEALCHEHVEMYAQLDTLRRHVAEQSIAWSDLRRDFTVFLGRFQTHETAENDMLQEAYCNDLGSKD